MWTPFLAASIASASPLSVDDLQQTERTATALIERCQRLGPACGATAAQLGEAFVARATAAAVLRGDLDVVAVANGTLLAPAAVAVWRDLLPGTADTEPDAWVVAWIADRWPDPPQPPPPARDPSQRSDPRPTVARAVLSGFRVSDDDYTSPVTSYAVTGEVRGTVGSGLGRIGIVASGGVIDRATEGSIGIGPRWVRGGAFELLPYVGVDAATGRLQSRTWFDGPPFRLADDPRFLGIGARVGVIAVHSLRTDDRWSMRWTVGARSMRHWRMGRQGGVQLMWYQPDEGLPAVAQIEIRPELQLKVGERGRVGVAMVMALIGAEDETEGHLGASATIGWRL